MTVLEADGDLLEQRKLSMDRRTLQEYFGKVPKPTKAAVEATFNGYYFLDLIEPLPARGSSTTGWTRGFRPSW